MPDLQFLDTDVVHMSMDNPGEEGGGGGAIAECSRSGGFHGGLDGVDGGFRCTLSPPGANPGMATTCGRGGRRRRATRPVVIPKEGFFVVRRAHRVYMSLKGVPQLQSAGLRPLVARLWLSYPGERVRRAGGLLPPITSCRKEKHANPARKGHVLQVSKGKKKGKKCFSFPTNTASVNLVLGSSKGFFPLF